MKLILCENSQRQVSRPNFIFVSLPILKIN